MPYAKNLWYVAAWSHDLKANQPLGVQILGESIVLWRNDQGRIAALQDRCVHRLAPLSLGRCEGDNLRCMYHGLLYNASGAVTEIPGQDVIPPQAKVRPYPVVDRHSWIWVWMGEASAADETLIPPAVGLDDPNFIFGFGQLDYAAEARLINDNLLDFSHLSYVHAASFGASEQWARERPKVIPLAQGVRVERWVTVQPGAPGRDYAHPVEQYSHYDFLLPGVLLMTGGAFPLGTKDQLDGNAPNLDLAIGGVTFLSLIHI